jgi:23S rRNA G2445 N2-methylase RlmL
MAHKALVLTFPGMTDICAQEIKELTGISGKETSEAVIFEASLEEIFVICYRSHTAARVLLVVSEGKIEELSIPKQWLTGTISITGKSNTKAQQLAERITANKVYKNADIQFYLHFEDEQCWLGIDLTQDLTKRDYRIFIGSETLTGITAFAALKLAGYKQNQTLIDPFCRAGSIVIEAALSALQLPPRYYSKDKLPMRKLFKEVDFEKFFAAQDKNIKEKIAGSIIALSEQFPSVQATRKNAKIAGVVKAIDFSRTALDWLNLKFEKQSIDRIVTQPTELTKNFPPEKFKKLTGLFFKRAASILKKRGKICFVLRQGVEEYRTAAKNAGFTIENECTVMQGKEQWRVFIFSRT